MALYITIEGDKQSVNLVGGDALGHAYDLLEPIFKRLEVTPLLDFFSMNPDEPSEEDGERIEILWKEEWFLAEEGLKTVRALLNHLQHHEVVGVNEGIFRDLQDFERALVQAEQRGTRWHLGIDD